MKRILVLKNGTEVIAGIIVNTIRQEDGQKKEDLRLPFELNIEVEHIGVEPMTSCMPCKRSSQLS
ncbi:hypothetical protein IMPR6_690215 [Imperialibacter sp. EC-SDR9]|nr:hypothetical protein IMPERIA89_340215 [Imperialibacter sp. 89]CAD5297064.1 hypothetical protein IMPERIA75_700215 [Imperialibacter sp. 75]VVT34013.1 hypothetical protein IMPR6_690215 [Imperialibacter sp. EC-SDR9]